MFLKACSNIGLSGSIVEGRVDDWVLDDYLTHGVWVLWMAGLLLICCSMHHETPSKDKWQASSCSPAGANSSGMALAQTVFSAFQTSLSSLESSPKARPKVR